MPQSLKTFLNTLLAMALICFVVPAVLIIGGTFLFRYLDWLLVVAKGVAF